MEISNYIYGIATNNMHGNLTDAVEAGIITEKEAEKYNYYANCVMSGSRYKGEFPELLQFKLDKFFKKDEIDYQDFAHLCQNLSGDKFVTICCPELFQKGDYCYYDNKGNTINVNFISRFEKGEE